MTLICAESVQDSTCAGSVPVLLVSYLGTVHQNFYLDIKIKSILSRSVLASNAGLYSSREGSPTRADFECVVFLPLLKCST